MTVIPLAASIVELHHAIRKLGPLVHIFMVVGITRGHKGALSYSKGGCLASKSSLTDRYKS